MVIEAQQSGPVHLRFIDLGPSKEHITCGLGPPKYSFICNSNKGICESWYFLENFYDVTPVGYLDIASVLYIICIICSSLCIFYKPKNSGYMVYLGRIYLTPKEKSIKILKYSTSD